MQHTFERRSFVGSSAESRTKVSTALTLFSHPPCYYYFHPVLPLRPGPGCALPWNVRLRHLPLTFFHCLNLRIAPLSSQLMLALNEEYIEKDGEAIVLKAGDQLAIIPPLSGG